jgi:hypothetical protein
MTDPSVIVVAASGSAATAIAAFAALRGWNQWLALKRLQATSDQPEARGGELAELRKRVRKLEAIASGIEL